MKKLARMYVMTLETPDAPSVSPVATFEIDSFRTEEQVLEHIRSVAVEHLKAIQTAGGQVEDDREFSVAKKFTHDRDSDRFGFFRIVQKGRRVTDSEEAFCLYPVERIYLIGSNNQLHKR